MPQQDRQELSDYLHEYAQATADGQGPSASALSVGAAYFRYPAAALLLGLTAAGLVLLPVLSVVQGFFLSFSVGCFARALGRGGVYLALAAFGPRCLFVLPCTLLLTVQVYPPPRTAAADSAPACRMPPIGGGQGCAA